MMKPKMKKKTKIRIIDGINYILRIIIPILAIIWVGGMLIDMVQNIGTKNYSFFVNYAQISLTLFGFTLIGGIFELNKEKPKIVKQMFILSLWFLASAISFLIIYSFLFLKFEGTIKIIGTIALPILMVLGFGGFVLGILYLFTVLFNYLKKVI